MEMSLGIPYEKSFKIHDKLMCYTYNAITHKREGTFRLVEHEFRNTDGFAPFSHTRFYYRYSGLEKLCHLHSITDSMSNIKKINPKITIMSTMNDVTTISNAQIIIHLRSTDTSSYVTEFPLHPSSYNSNEITFGHEIQCNRLDLSMYNILCVKIDGGYDTNFFKEGGIKLEWELEFTIEARSQLFKNSAQIQRLTERFSDICFEFGSKKRKCDALNV